MSATATTLSKTLSPKKISLVKKDLSARALEVLWQHRPEAFYMLGHDVLFSARPMALKERWKNLMKEAVREDLLVPETGAHVATYSFGTGPSVILVHGWAARGMQLSDLVTPLVERGLQVVVYDQPGHGESGLRSTNIFQFIYSLKRVIEHKRDVHALVGHSMGCSAISANLQWFPWIEKVVMLAPHANLRQEMTGWITSRGLSEEMVGSLVSWLEARYELSFDQINLDQIGEQIESDVLLIHDEDDEATAFENSQKLNQLIEGSEFYGTQGLGHFRIVRDPVIRYKVIDWVTAR